MDVEQGRRDDYPQPKSYPRERHAVFQGRQRWELGAVWSPEAGCWTWWARSWRPYRVALSSTSMLEPDRRSPEKALEAAAHSVRGWEPRLYE